MENKTINLELTVEEANYVLFALSKMPFDQVFNLIGKVKQQAEQQVNNSQEMRTMSLPDKKD